MKTSNDIIISAGSTGVEARHGQAVAQLKNGNVVTVWHGVSPGLDASGAGVFAKILKLDGNIVQDIFPVNSYKTSDQVYATVTALKNGGFVVAWQSYGQDGSILGYIWADFQG